jgi:hypothetical protein
LKVECGSLSASGEEAAANSRSVDRRLLCRGGDRGKTVVYVEVHDKADTEATDIQLIDDEGIIFEGDFRRGNGEAMLTDGSVGGLEGREGTCMSAEARRGDVPIVSDEGAVAGASTPVSAEIGGGAASSIAWALGVFMGIARHDVCDGVNTSWLDRTPWELPQYSVGREEGGEF